MAIYKCELCGHIYDEDKEGVLFCDLPSDWSCPACGGPKHLFKKVEECTTNNPAQKTDNNPLAYPEDFYKQSSDAEPLMAAIHEMAVYGKSLSEPMGTRLPLISWNDILFMGAQLSVQPLDDGAPVNVQTIIGKNAKKPMVLESPIYVSHMSFGALSKEMKVALSKGTAMVKTAMCSGEGGMLPEEYNAAYKYIFEYIPNKYSVTPENLKKSDAIEIKIGQGTKPGMGGHLPGSKVTPEIATMRGKPVGEDIVSPSHYPDINTPEDLKKLVDELRTVSEGRPIGVKIAAGRIEEDIAFILRAKPDFITIDGRGGATGSSPKMLKDASSVPTIYALYRARKFLDEQKSDIELVITGGLRVSADFAKAIAMGADAIAIASSALMAAACQQYRICQTGRCPVGVATQDPDLRKRLQVETAAKRLANFLTVSTEELKIFARVTGHKDVHDLNYDDIFTTNSEISSHTKIKHC